MYLSMTNQGGISTFLFVSKWNALDPMPFFFFCTGFRKMRQQTAYTFSLALEH